MKATQVCATKENQSIEKPCIICGKSTLGWGLWREGAVCSKACNTAQSNKLFHNSEKHDEQQMRSL